MFENSTDVSSMQPEMGTAGPLGQDGRTRLT